MPNAETLVRYVADDNFDIQDRGFIDGPGGNVRRFVISKQGLQSFLDVDNWDDASQDLLILLANMAMNDIAARLATNRQPDGSP